MHCILELEILILKLTIDLKNMNMKTKKHLKAKNTTKLMSNQNPNLQILTYKMPLKGDKVASQCNCL